MLTKGTMIKTVYGDWVKVVSHFDNMVTADNGRYRTMYHISKLLLSTAVVK